MLELPSPGTALETMIDGAVGPLQTLIAAPRGEARGLALICHPHPLMGGAMTNKVTYTLASTALKAGLYALRFNFRGVGKSAGEHDHGRGESDDVVALASTLRQAWTARHGGAAAPLMLAGFSFGGYVSLRAAQRIGPSLLVSVAPPLTRFVDTEAGLPEHPGCPWLLVHARDDEVVPFSESDHILAHYDPPPVRAELAEAGHFFHGKLGELGGIVLPFIDQHWPLPGSGG